MTTAESAAGLAERGFAVFPVLPNDKKPAIERWPDLACVDRAKVREAWPTGHNIGIATGQSGLVVVDLDRGKAVPPPWDTEPGVVDGADVWAILRQRYDPTWPSWLPKRRQSVLEHALSNEGGLEYHPIEGDES